MKKNKFVRNVIPGLAGVSIFASIISSGSNDLEKISNVSKQKLENDKVFDSKEKDGDKTGSPFTKDLGGKKSAPSKSGGQQAASSSPSPTFAVWYNSDKSNVSFQKWLKSAEGQKDLRAHWLKTSDFTAALKRWATVKNKYDWADLEASNKAKRDWILSKVDYDQLRYNFIQSPSFKTAFINWQSKFIKGSKDIWLNSKHGEDAFLAWRRSSTGRAEVIKAFKASGSNLPTILKNQFSGFKKSGNTTKRTFDEFLNSQKKATNYQPTDAEMKYFLNLSSSKTYLINWLNNHSNDFVTKWKQSSSYQQAKQKWFRGKGMVKLSLYEIRQNPQFYVKLFINWLKEDSTFDLFMKYHYVYINKTIDPTTNLPIKKYGLWNDKDLNILSGTLSFDNGKSTGYYGRANSEWKIYWSKKYPSIDFSTNESKTQYKIEKTKIFNKFYQLWIKEQFSQYDYNFILQTVKNVFSSKSILNQKYTYDQATKTFTLNKEFLNSQKAFDETYYSSVKDTTLIYDAKSVLNNNIENDYEKSTQYTKDLQDAKNNLSLVREFFTIYAKENNSYQPYINWYNDNVYSDVDNHFNNWKQSDGSKANLKNKWKSSLDFKFSRDKWLSQNKNNWTIRDYVLKSKEANQYLSTWKSSINGNAMLLKEWKKSQDYLTNEYNWKKQLPKPLNKKEFFEDKDNKFGVQTLFNNWKGGSNYLDDLKNEWKKTKDYTQKVNSFLNKNKKRNKDFFAKSSFSNPAYLKWVTTDFDSSAKTSLFSVWSKTSDYTKALNSWIKNGPSKASTDQFLKTKEAEGYYNIWRLTTDGRTTLKAYFKNTSTFTKKANDWISEGAKKRGKRYYAKNIYQSHYTDFIKKTSSWRTKLENFYILSPTSNYSQKKDDWLKKQVAKRDEDYYFKNNQFSNSEFYTWAKDAKGKKVLSPHLQATTSYQTAYKKWLITFGQKGDKDTYFKTNEVSTKYNNWRALSSTNKLFAKNYPTTGDYTSKKSQWQKKQEAASKRSVDTFINLPIGQTLFNKWRKTNDGHGLLLSDYTKYETKNKDAEFIKWRDDINTKRDEKFYFDQSRPEAKQLFKKWRESKEGIGILKTKYESKKDDITSHYYLDLEDFIKNTPKKRTFQEWAKLSYSDNAYYNWYQKEKNSLNLINAFKNTNEWKKIEKDYRNNNPILKTFTEFTSSPKFDKYYKEWLASANGLKSKNDYIKELLKRDSREEKINVINELFKTKKSIDFSQLYLLASNEQELFIKHLEKEKIISKYSSSKGDLAYFLDRNINVFDALKSSSLIDKEKSAWDKEYITKLYKREFKTYEDDPLSRVIFIKFLEQLKNYMSNIDSSHYTSIRSYVRKVALDVGAPTSHPTDYVKNHPKEFILAIWNKLKKEKPKWVNLFKDLGANFNLKNTFINPESLSFPDDLFAKLDLKYDFIDMFFWFISLNYNLYHYPIYRMIGLINNNLTDLKKNIYNTASFKNNPLYKPYKALSREYKKNSSFYEEITGDLIDTSGLFFEGPYKTIFEDAYFGSNEFKVLYKDKLKTIETFKDYYYAFSKTPLNDSKLKNQPSYTVFMENIKMPDLIKMDWSKFIISKDDNYDFNLKQNFDAWFNKKLKDNAYLSRVQKKLGYNLLDKDGIKLWAIKHKYEFIRLFFETNPDDHFKKWIDNAYKYALNHHNTSNAYLVNKIEEWRANDYFNNFAKKDFESYKNSWNTEFDKFINKSVVTFYSNKANGADQFIKSISSSYKPYVDWNDPLVRFKKDYVLGNSIYDANLQKFGDRMSIANDKLLTTFKNSNFAHKAYLNWNDKDYKTHANYIKSGAREKNFNAWVDKKTDSIVTFKNSSFLKNEYSNWNDPIVNIDYDNNNQFVVDYKKYYADKNNGKTLFMATDDFKKGYDNWQDPNAKKEKDFWLSSLYSNLYDVWLVENETQNKNYWKATSDFQNAYDNWKDPQATTESDYQKSNQFTTDFEPWIANIDNGLDFFIQSNDLITNYNKWNDTLVVRTKAAYLKTATFTSDLDDWSSNKVNGEIYFEASKYFGKIYKNWVDPNVRTKADYDNHVNGEYVNSLKRWAQIKANGISEFKKVIAFNQAYDSWTDQNAKSITDYVVDGQFNNDFNNWKGNLTSQDLTMVEKDAYMNTKEFINKYFVYLNSTSKPYEKSQKGQQDFTKWQTDNLDDVKEVYMQSKFAKDNFAIWNQSQNWNEDRYIKIGSYEADYDYWYNAIDPTTNVQINVYDEFKHSNYIKSIYNLWTDVLLRTDDDYYFSEYFENIISNWFKLDKRLDLGSLYSTIANKFKATPDSTNTYNAWSDYETKSQDKYYVSNDFNNDLLAYVNDNKYRDKAKTDKGSKGYKLFVSSKNTDKSYTDWKPKPSLTKEADYILSTADEIDFDIWFNKITKSTTGIQSLFAKSKIGSDAFAKRND